MLSFEVSAIDVVLMISVIVLLALFITQKRSHVVTESQSSTLTEEIKAEDQEKEDQIIARDSKKGENISRFQKCIHHFGYLSNLPQNTSVPDECFGCPKAMRCLFPNEQDQIAR
jgi:hypothetical protein